MNYDTRIKKSQRPLRIDPIVDELCAKHERVRRAAPELLEALGPLIGVAHWAMDHGGNKPAIRAMISLAENAKAKAEVQS